MSTKRKPSRRGQFKIEKEASASHRSTHPSHRTLDEVLCKYAIALQAKPKSMSFVDQIPELQIRAALQELFPDARFSGRRDWSCHKPLSIRRAFQELVASRDKMDGLIERFELIREIVIPCYRTVDLARCDAMLLANGEDLGQEFQGFALTEQQIKSLMAPPPDAQEAMQGIMFMADMWPMPFKTNESLAHFGRCLETMAQLLRDRGACKIKSLDIALGFSGAGRGHSSYRKRMETRNAWNDNCFVIHLLHLSGAPIFEACQRYVDGQELGRKSASAEVFEKQYRSWRNEPVTCVGLHLGDPLAKMILSLPDVRHLLEKRFPPSQ